jgi:hypothetical protein
VVVAALLNRENIAPNIINPIPKRVRDDQKKGGLNERDVRTSQNKDGVDERLRNQLGRNKKRKALTPEQREAKKLRDNAANKKQRKFVNKGKRLGVEKQKEKESESNTKTPNGKTVSFFGTILEGAANNTSNRSTSGSISLAGIIT